MPSHKKSSAMPASNNRQFSRKTVDAPYSEVRVRRGGRGGYNMAGHVYDISSGGMRFELDKALDHGEKIEVQVRLPGMSNRLIRATGRIIRFHDPDETGPIRMAMMFTELARTSDRQLLDRYTRASEQKAA